MLLRTASSFFLPRNVKIAVFVLLLTFASILSFSKYRIAASVTLSSRSSGVFRIVRRRGNDLKIQPCVESQNVHLRSLQIYFEIYNAMAIL